MSVEAAPLRGQDASPPPSQRSRGAQARLGRLLRRGGVADRLAGPVATVLLSLVGMAQALRIWSWRPGTPLGLTGDAPWMAALVQGYLEYGPYADNPRFGAPFALNTGWSSAGNDVHAWALTALGWFTSDPFTALALYFFASFPLSALTMYWLCRRYGATRPAAVLAGVLFSVLPGHQERFPHLFLAAYWAVPFAAWVVIESAQGNGVLAGRRGVDAPSAHRGRLVAVLMLLAIGLGDIYYVAFTLLIAVPIVLLRQLRRRDAHELVALGVPLGVMTLPALVSIWFARRRADRDVLTGGLPWGRTFIDSDRWSGRLIDLVLPWPGHRVPSLATTTQAYDALTGSAGEVSSLGVVALAGVVGLVTVVGAGLVRRPSAPARPVVVALAVATVIAAAFYTRGGLGSLVAFFVTPQVRTWSRLFLFIALFGLMAVALFVSRLAAARGRRLAGLLAAALLVLGVLDQTSPARAPDYPALRADLAGLSAFDDHVESALGRDCSLFVLPVVGFPEVNDDLVPDLMSLGLASKHLRWSFGAIKGTADADWQIGLSTDDASRLADDLASLGYCGVVVERSLATRAPQLAAGLPRELGVPVARSQDGAYVALDLRARRERLVRQLGADGVDQRAAAALHPVVATLDGAWALDEAAGRRYPLGPGPSIELANLSDTARRVTVEVSFLGPAQGTYTARLTGPGGAMQAVHAGPREPVTASITVTAPPGRSRVALARLGEATDWSSLLDRSALPSVTRIRTSAADPSVNTGVDLPTP